MVVPLVAPENQRKANLFIQTLNSEIEDSKWKRAVSRIDLICQANSADFVFLV